MRDAIVDTVHRAAPFPGARELENTPGNIVDALLAVGAEPYLVLSACCAATGLPAARRAWLEGPLPTWPANFDIGFCRQLGCCPVAQRKGQWVVAYSDPELAVAAESLGLPDHVRCLALPRDLERFFAAAPDDVAPSEQTLQTDPVGELFVPQSQLDHDPLNTDKVAQPGSATSAGDANDDANDANDDDDDDLDLYVDRLADQLTQQQTRPTVGKPPASRRGAALDPPLPPRRPVRPAPMLSTPVVPSSPPLPSRASPVRPATTRPPREPTRQLQGESVPPASSPRKGPPGAPSPPSRAALLIGGAAACVAVAVILWPRLSAPPLVAPPAQTTVGVKDGALDFSVAQQALLDRARAEPEPAAAMRHLSEAIKLDPTSTVARTALLERTRHALTRGFLTQVDNDLERLRRRKDVGEIRAELEALSAKRAATPEHRPEAPPSTPPPSVLPGDGAVPVVPDHGASGFIHGVNTVPPDEAPPPP